jgi:hypothetical protein
MRVVTPVVSVIIAWRNRTELAPALRQNAPVLNAVGAEVLIVNGGGDRSQLRELTENSSCHDLRIVEVNTTRTFNKSACLNVGGYVSRGTHLFVLDADIIVTGSFLTRAVDEVTQGGCFVSLADVVESAPPKPRPYVAPGFVRERVITTELTRPDGRSASLEYRTSTDGRRSGPGMVMVRREHFMAVHGFNSRLRGWGFEDNDFLIRLQLGLGLRRLTFGQASHLSHPPAPFRKHARNIDICTENYARGQLHGTLTDDVKRWQRRAAAAAPHRPRPPLAAS